MIPVLCYHYFGMNRNLQPGIKLEDVAYITPMVDFEETLMTLDRAGYEFSTIKALPSPGKKLCMITIDDAHRSVLTHAFPLLQKLGITAVLFVVPTWVGRNGYLNWAEIQSLVDHGWEIGIHGHTHRRLTTLSDSEVVQELSEARDALRSQLTPKFISTLGDEFPSLAVPMGGISARIERLARQQGFSYILNSHYGIWKGQSEHCVPRIVVKQPYDSANEIRNLIVGGVSFRGTELRLRSVVKQMRDRVIEWKQGRF